VIRAKAGRVAGSRALAGADEFTAVINVTWY
jgi:hypothetical protein